MEQQKLADTNMKSCSKTCKAVTVIVTAVVILVLGICAITLSATLYNTLLRDELTLSKNSKGFLLWKETPIPMYLNVYLFNWTNSKEVLKDWNVKPVFNEHGPYVFYEHHVRVNMTWNENGTITYQQKKIWRFLPEVSNGTLADNITSVNVIATVVGYMVRKKPSLVKELVSFFIELKEKELALTKTVDEWLFSGYDDELLEMAAKLNISSLNIPYTKFGWFYGRNNSETYDGNFTIYTGESDLDLLGIMDTWNGSPLTKFYSNYCAYVNGTTGELWPPVNNYDKVSLFVSDLCSTLWLFKSDRTNYVHGLEGKTFVGTDYIFDNGTKYPEQKCFNGDRVFPSGIRDISKCKFGAPAFVSFPHFYLADPIYSKSVKGMRPNKTKHEFYMTLEPNTGIPLEAHAGMQINLLVEPIKNLKMFEHVKATFMPLLWFSQTAELTSDLASQTKTLLMMPSIFTFTGYGMIIITILLLLTAIYIMYPKEQTDADREVTRLIEETS